MRYQICISKEVNKFFGDRRVIRVGLDNKGDVQTTEFCGFVGERYGYVYWMEGDRKIHLTGDTLSSWCVEISYIINTANNVTNIELDCLKVLVDLGGIDIHFDVLDDPIQKILDNGPDTIVDPDIPDTIDVLRKLCRAGFVSSKQIPQYDDNLLIGYSTIWSTT